MAKEHVSRKLYYYALVAVIMSTLVGLGRPGIAQAQSPQLLITEVQTQSATSQTEEFVELYNQSNVDIPLKNVELFYLTAVGNAALMKVSPEPGNSVLQARSFLLLTRSTWSNIVSDGTFTVGLNESGGHIQVKYAGTVSDTVGWGTAVKAETAPAKAVEKGASLTRRVDANGLFVDSNNNSQDFIETVPSPIGGGVTEAEEPDQLEEPTEEDWCLNIVGIQAEVPLGYARDSAGNCMPAAQCTVLISEISAQPNFDGKEYIEVYNNSEEIARLNLCKFSINGAAEKALPEHNLQPGEYFAVTFTSGAIRNSAGSILLVNSDGARIHYDYPSTNLGQSVNYDASGLRAVTNFPSPSLPNIANTLEEVGGSGAGSTSLADCGPGKYRNPETNRCKNIESTASVLVPCAADQERNPETNRCRKIASVSTTLKPCAADQFRNPETNRCKKIASAEGTLKPCAVGQERNPETNRCRKIASSVSGTPLDVAAQPAAISPFPYKTPLIGLLGAVLMGYGAYEYRSEIQNQIQKLRDKRIRGRPPG